MVVVENKAERGYVTFHRKLPWGQKKICCTIREGIEKKLRSYSPPPLSHYHRDDHSLLESHLFTLFFFSSWKANKEKRKKDRERYFNRYVRNISLLFNNSCSEFIYDINDYNDSCSKMADDGISIASP